jgi:hypothetical protein
VLPAFSLVEAVSFGFRPTSSWLRGCSLSTRDQSPICSANRRSWQECRLPGQQWAILLPAPLRAHSAESPRAPAGIAGLDSGHRVVAQGAEVGVGHGGAEDGGGQQGSEGQTCDRFHQEHSFTLLRDTGNLVSCHDMLLARPTKAVFV